MVRPRLLAGALAAGVVLLVPAGASGSGLDGSFGSSGRTEVALNGGWNAGAGVDAFRLGDDRIVVAGLEDGYGLAVTRHTPSGQLDTSFDGDGIATVGLQGVDGFDMTLSPDVGGVAVDGAGSTFVALTSGTQGFVVKLTPGGAPDGAFGGGDGVLAVGNATGDPRNTAGGIRLNPMGTRLHVATGENETLRVWGLSPATGSPDMTFGSGGVRDLALGGAAGAGDLVVSPVTGEITVTGKVFTPEPRQFVARFNDSGTALGSFGAGGVARPWDGASAQVSTGSDLFVTADGRPTVVGSADAGESLAVARLNPDGSRDGSFSNGGLLTEYVPTTYTLRGYDGVNVQGDGGIVAAGSRFTANFTGSEVVVRRYSAGGAPDTTLDVRIGDLVGAGALAAQAGPSRYVVPAFTSSTPHRLVLLGIPASLPAPPPPPPAPPAPQPPAPQPPASPPAAPAPAPVPAGCTRTVAIGPLTVEGSCLKREGMIWTTSASASVGGLKFVPNGANAQLIIDPLNVRIAARGNAKIVAAATLFGRQFGPVTLYAGAFDWTFQYRDELARLARTVMPQPGAGGRAISLPTLAKLPGLSGVARLPRLPDLGLPNFGRLAAADVSKLAGRIPSLRTPNVSIPLSLVGLPSLPELRFSLPSSAGSLLGFPVGGQVGVKMGERSGVRGVDVSMTLRLPAALGGLTGDTRFFVGVGGQLVVDALGVDATEIGFPLGIRAAPVRLRYDGAQDLWSGGTALYLGFSEKDSALGGSFEIQGGRLRKIGVIAGPVPLGGAVTLDRIDATFTADPIRLLGSTTFGAGPRVPALGSRIVTGNATADFNGNFFKLTGGVGIANVPLANAEVEYWWNGYFAAKGRMEYFIDAKREYGFTMNVDGEASSKGFNVEGGATFKAKDKSLAGKAILSSKGVAGCASIKGFLWQNIQLGAGYKWNDKYISWIGGSCDFGPYRAKLRAVAAQAGGAQTIQISGDRAASLKIAGGGAAPQFTLRGPDGSTVTTPADGTTVIDERFVVIQQPEENVTYVAIAKPKGGSWTITPAAGSAAITSVQGADALPEPSVSARVRRGRVVYTVKRIPGQRVSFVEEGKQVAAEIGTAKGARGSFALRPSPGPGGRRRIIAVVEQGDYVRSRIPVASYTASSKALRAPKVTLKKLGKGRLRATWRPVSGARGWVVTSNVGGRKERRTLAARTRRITLTGLLTTTGADVRVQAVGGPTRLGKTGRGKVAKPSTRKRTGKVPKAKKKKKTSSAKRKRRAVAAASAA